MAYLVLLQRRAERDLRSISRYIRADSSPAAGEWLEGFYSAIESLCTLPDRGVIIQREPSVRQISYGKRPHIYHVLYTVDKKQSTVNVLHIRHGAREPLKEP